MNKEQINKAFFEDLHQTQMNQINTSAIDDARKVILKLILYMNTADKGISAEKDEAVLGALRWLKNNVS
tara:strand:- start:207 stop:413 length:207 start_codon:yes stop_codon:yes gene_type:complete